MNHGSKWYPIRVWNRDDYPYGWVTTGYTSSVFKRKVPRSVPIILSRLQPWKF